MTDDLGPATIPRPMVPGAEIEALRRFHREGTWEGIIHPGGMGPGTPLQRAIGTARHQWIQDGRWVVGDYQQDQMLEDGTFVLSGICTGYAAGTRWPPNTRQPSPTTTVAPTS